MSVSRNHDRAFHGNARAVQLFVILGHSVIHINERTRHVSVNRIRVVRRQLLTRWFEVDLLAAPLLQFRFEKRPAFH